MNRKITFSTALVLMLIVALITFLITLTSIGGVYNGYLNQFADPSANIPASFYHKLANVSQIVSENYVKEVDPSYLQDMLLAGYVAGLGDPHSYYLTAEEFERHYNSIAGNMTGIGIRVFYDPDDYSMSVFEVMANSPAQNAGLLPGDKIYSANSVLYDTVGYEGMYNEIIGVEGTALDLTVKRGDALVDFQIVRTVFEAQTVSYRMLRSDPSVALVTIVSFDVTTSSQFVKAMDKILLGGAKKIIFDVRSNPGGELNSIASILDFLLPEGPIVRFVDKQGNQTQQNSDASGVDLPMAVLVNEHSASAAELFAAALQDYKKAVIVGTVTYGKGTLQSTIPLNDGSAVHLSTNYYLPPFSDSYDEIGVIPDIEVSLSPYSSEHFYKIDETQDEQLMAALDALKNK